MRQRPPSFEKVRNVIIPRISVRPTPCSKELIPHKLYVTLAWNGHSGWTEVTPTILEYWGKSFSTLFEIAQWNLHRRTASERWTEIDTIRGLYTYISKDRCASSRLLCLRELVRPFPAEGVLVAAPTPDQLLVLPLTHPDVLETMRVMVMACYTAQDEQDNVLSDQVYWYDGTQWELLSVDHSNDRIEIQTSSRLMDALERTTAVYMATVAEA